MYCYHKIVFDLPFNMYTIHRFFDAACFVGVGVVPLERNHKISAHIKYNFDIKEVSHIRKEVHCLPHFSVTFFFQYQIKFYDRFSS